MSVTMSCHLMFKIIRKHVVLKWLSFLAWRLYTVHDSHAYSRTVSTTAMNLLADSLSVPHFLPESSKCRVGFGESVIDFHVDVGFSGEGASQVGERIGTFQWLVIHKDTLLVIHLSRLTRCRLVHDFCLLGADCRTKFVASSRKVIHALLHFRFSVAVKSAVIRKEEFSQCGYLHLCHCFELSEVEHSSICSVLQLDAIVIIL